MNLFEQWCEGYQPDSFWHQPPRLIRAALNALDARRTWDMRRTMSGAWHGGVIAKSTKTPPLSQLLGDEVKVQTPEEMSSALDAWVAATAHLAKPDASSPDDVRCSQASQG